MKVLIFLLALTGLSLLLGSSPLVPLMWLREQAVSKAARAAEIQRPPAGLDGLNSGPPWRRYVRRVDALIALPSNRWTTGGYWQITAALSAAGLLSGNLTGNPYLAAVFGIGFALLPYLVLTDLHYRYLRSMTRSLSLGMTLLTNDYLQTEDLISSAANHYERLEEPLRTLILTFLTDVQVLNPDVKSAVRKMAQRVEDYYFSRWCDVLIQCQDDRDFKSILPAIIAEMTDVRKQQSEHDRMMRKSYYSYWQLVLIAAAGLPVLGAVNGDLAVYLIRLPAGQIITALLFAVLFGTACSVITGNRPIGIRKGPS